MSKIKPLNWNSGQETKGQRRASEEFDIGDYDYTEDIEEEEIPNQETEQRDLQEEKSRYEPEQIWNERVHSMLQAVPIEHPQLVIANGMKRSGKSTVVESMVFEGSQAGPVVDGKPTSLWDRVYVLCPTDGLQSTYNFMKKNPRYVIKNPNDMTIDWILKEQVRLNSPDEKTGRKRYFSALIVADDVVGSVNFHRSKAWDKLATTHRHYNLSIYVITQGLTKISPSLRDNADHLILTVPKGDNIEHAFKMIRRGFRNKHEFTLFCNRNLVFDQKRGLMCFLSLPLANGGDNDYMLFTPHAVRHEWYIAPESK